MKSNQVPVVTVKEKVKELFPIEIKQSLEMLDCKIQQMRNIQICEVTN